MRYAKSVAVNEVCMTSESLTGPLSKMIWQTPLERLRVKKRIHFEGNERYIAARSKLNEASAHGG